MILMTDINSLQLTDMHLFNSALYINHGDNIQPHLNITEVSNRISPNLTSKDRNDHFAKLPCNATFKSEHVVVFDRASFKGRLGNQMFQLLTLLSTAKTNCLKPILAP